MFLLIIFSDINGYLTRFDIFWIGEIVYYLKSGHLII